MEENGAGGGGRNSRAEEITGAKTQQRTTAVYPWAIVHVFACNQKGGHIHLQSYGNVIRARNMHFCLNNHSDFCVASQWP